MQPINHPIVQGYNEFTEGDLVPSLNKKIQTLTMKDTSFIVFLDEEYNVQYCTNPELYKKEHPEYSKFFSKTVSRANFLEEAALNVLEPRSRLHIAIANQIAESVARVLDSPKTNEATEILDKVEKYLSNIARYRYIKAAFFCALSFILFTLTIWLLGGHVEPILKSRTLFESILGAGMGSIGAFVSVILRYKNMEIDPLAKKAEHYKEGCLRILLGAIAGAVMIPAIQSNIILGFVKDLTTASLGLKMLMALISGASEMLFPTLIERGEALVANNKKDEKS